MTIAHRPQYCQGSDCKRNQTLYKSARWQQIAPRYCTYGYDMIAQIGWWRQTHCERFEAIHAALQPRLQICESEVRLLYHERYLPLLACHERQYLEELKAVSEHRGLILSLDGLAPEGGEPQLWLIRELQLGLTLRSGWLSRQDEATFVNFLQPIADLGLRVVAVMSDKQRGLEPAVPIVFPEAKHGFCQLHYLGNAAEPVAEEDQAMKMTLRKAVRDEVGEIIRREKVEKTGVLTVTGLIPTPVEAPQEPTEVASQASQPIHDPIVQEHEAIVQDLLRRVRYLLTLKGRPPFRLAGIEMYERLAEVQICLDMLLDHRTDSRLAELKQGLLTALNSAQADYAELRQAANWLQHIDDLLDPEGKPARTGAQVQRELFAYLKDIDQESQDSPRLRRFCKKIRKTTLSYAPGLFHCYNTPGLPRTNNDRESEFRDLNRRLLSTTGQKGLVKRIIQREGAWELIPRPESLRDTISALSHVNPDAFSQERQRIRQHRARFRLHTRSAKQSRTQLKQLEQRWKALPPLDNS
ncbi:MAG: transposase [Anaerolineaceae bacterium]|nr:transposase [Anaerolineaceae bacterium]